MLNCIKIKRNFAVICMLAIGFVFCFSSAAALASTNPKPNNNSSKSIGCKYDGKNCFTNFINNGFKLKY